MSDLQCPVTIWLLTPETAAVSDLREQRLALVIFAETLPAALSFGQECIRVSLASGAALAERITELADSYRGEQVAIVASAQAIREALHLPAPPTAAISLSVDSDGWQVLSR
jgi:hypothetical protein